MISFKIIRSFMIIPILFLCVADTFCAPIVDEDNPNQYHQNAILYYGGNEELYEQRIKNTNYKIIDNPEVKIENQLWRLANERDRSNAYLKYISKLDTVHSSLCKSTAQTMCPKGQSNILYAGENKILFCSSGQTFQIPRRSKKIFQLEEILNYELRLNVLAVMSDKRMISSTNNTVKVLDKCRLEENVIKLNGHNGNVNSACELISGYIASGSDDMTVKIWDWKQKKCLSTFTEHRGSVEWVIGLNNGFIASCSSDKTVKVWMPDVKKSESFEKKKQCALDVTTFEEHESRINFLLQLTNGNLVSCSDDKTLKVWSWDQPSKNGSSITLKGHTDSVRSVIELVDGRLVSCSNDKTLKVWDLSKTQGHECIATLYGHDSTIESILQLANGQIVSSDQEGIVKIWGLHDPGTNYLQSLPNEILEKIMTILYKVGASSLAEVNRFFQKIFFSACLQIKKKQYFGDHAAMYRKSIRGRYIQDLPIEIFTEEQNEDPLNKLAFWRFVDNKYLKILKSKGLETTENSDYFMMTRETSETSEKAVVHIEHMFNANEILVGYDDGTLEILKCGNPPNEKRELLLSIDAENRHKMSVTIVACLSNGQFISGSRDGIVKIWDCIKNKGKCVGTLVGHTVKIKLIQEVLNNKLITCCDNGYIKLWDMTTNREIRTFEKACTTCNPIMLDNVCMVAEGSECTVNVWDINNVNKINLLRVFKGHAMGITVLLQLHDKRIVSGSNDDFGIKVWDLTIKNDEDCLQELEAHIGGVWSMLQMDNGHLISVGKKNKDAQIWDMNKPNCPCIRYLIGFREPTVMQLMDGRIIARGGGKHHYNLWDMSMPSGEELIHSWSDMESTHGLLEISYKRLCSFIQHQNEIILRWGSCYY